MENMLDPDEDMPRVRTLCDVQRCQGKDLWSSGDGAALARDLGFVGHEVSPSHERRRGCPEGV